MIKLILWACFEFNFLLAKQRCYNHSDDVTLKYTDYPPLNETMERHDCLKVYCTSIYGVHLI